MNRKSLWIALTGVGFVIFAACSADPPVVKSSGYSQPYNFQSQNPYAGLSERERLWREDFARRGYSSASLLTSPVPRPSTSSRSASSLIREVNIRRDFLSYGARGRSRRKMSPRYITIHSTQNWSRGADANRHALALKRGALGRLSWHYTTDEDRAVQHLPTNEQGNHADYDGPGNRYSIGIEMCEHPGNSRTRTVDRTAKLAAWLMVRYNLPLSRVVPHYKWPRHGKRPANKNCPHFLLDGGKPGPKWRGFLNKVGRYHREMAGR